MTLTTSAPHHGTPIHTPARDISHAKVEAGPGGGCVLGCLARDFPWSLLPTPVPTGNLTGLSPPDTHCVGPGVGSNVSPVRAPNPLHLLLFLVKAGFYGKFQAVAPPPSLH